MADIRADLEYMALHVGPAEFMAAALREVERLQAERDAAQAANQRVREIHRPDGSGVCIECDRHSPCPTVRALDGDTTEEKR